MAFNTYQNKTALVTGAGSGIGRALSIALARRGARVFVTDLKKQCAQKTADIIKKEGHETHVYSLDVRNDQAFQDLTKIIQNKFGGLDFLFNNAGLAVAGEVKNLSTQDWRNVLEVNLMGVIHGIQAVYPMMVEQKSGHIVNTGSLGGFIPLPGSAPYGASKFAVVGLSLALRGEASFYGVKVSVLCPSLIDTPIFDNTEKRGFGAEALRENLRVPIPSAAAFAVEALNRVQANEAVILYPDNAKLIALGYRLFPEITNFFARQIFGKARKGNF